MTHNLVICRFLEQKYMILNLCTFFGTPDMTVQSFITITWQEKKLSLIKISNFFVSDHLKSESDVIPV